MKKYFPPLLVATILLACSSVGFKDVVYVLDAPNHNLRGHNPDGSDDKTLESCDPTPVPSPGTGLHYPCVAHFTVDYKALLKEVDRLEKELIACQQGYKP